VINTSTDVAPVVAAKYDRNVLRNAEPILLHARWAQKRPLTSKSGTTKKFRRYNLLSDVTTPLTEGVTPAGQAVTTTELECTPLQYGAYIEFSDVVDLVNEDNTLMEFSKILGQQAGTSIDKLHRDIMVAGTNVIYTNGSARTDLNTVISDVALRTAIRSLNRQNTTRISPKVSAGTGVGTAPVRSAYMSICHVDTEAHLESISGYKSTELYPSSALPDEIGSYRNIRFFATTNAKVFTNGGALIGGDGMVSTAGVRNDAYATLVFGAEAYGVVDLGGGGIQNIVKALGSGGTSDPLNQRGTSGWKAWVGGLILNQNWIVRVEHTCKSTLS
jgi:N4-gp56 family major capsid protein